MSYCRWSSDNWRCDVYVYEDVSGGWTTHVAGRKRMLPAIPDMPLEHFPDFGGKWSHETRLMTYPNRWAKLCAKVFFGLWAFWHNRVHMTSVRLIPLRPIGLAHDGESFNDPSPGECADRLVALRSAGYKVPQYAIDSLRQEETDGWTVEGTA